ncbi:RNA-binding protein 45 isoform X3 [Thrips palmi]|uniref:RNA-binding protein 45 isoform X3 n=1 Tax=Thrips palmi TaxID=161013 RepID=A0A6P9AKA7_THRPL|nr:RNA-binding protein 45 isoform X3 [Thrips palmi]
MAVRRSYSDRDSLDNHKSRQDEPPNSRLFIVHHKSITEDDFRKAFDKYGNIEEIWMLKDRATGDLKGITYIKFSKCSEAALAYEEMNGQAIEGNPRPLKVMIAHSREQGSKREMNEDERLTRLFIIVPKSTTDQELRDHFKQFGDLDYVSVVKDRETRESKGFAYVKYHRMSHAAKAFEDCDRSYKAVFAQPKKPREFSDSFSNNRDGANSRHEGSRNSNGLFESPSYTSYAPVDVGQGYPETGCRGLQVIAPAVLTQDQLWRLFDLVPGLDYCHLKSDPRSRMSRGTATVVYHKASQAAYAKDKLHGFEYPPGQRLIVKEDPSVRSGDPLSPSRALAARATTAVAPSVDIQSNLATLVDTLAQATSMIQAAGLAVPALTPARAALAATGGLSPTIRPANDPNYCSAKLPAAQPLAHIESEVKERLFIVCYPKAPPLHALRDVFGRFGSLIDIYILNGKNCGYAQYAEKESAEEAIKTLHGEEILSMRLKVMVAEPYTGEDRRKRIKMDVDN